MRFKAKFAPEQLSLLYHVIVPLSRIASSSYGGGDQGNSTSQTNAGGGGIWTRNGSILYLDSDYFRVSAKGSGSRSSCGSGDVDGDVRCFAEFSSHQIFAEHRIESAAPRNAIVMEVDLQQFRQALQSLQDGSSHHHHFGGGGGGRGYHHDGGSLTEMRLAKREGIPCLCLSGVPGGGGDGSGVEVHHTIPVRIRRVSEMPHYLPPKLQKSPDVQLELLSAEAATSTTLLRPLVDGLKSLSGTAYLKATTAGDLTISMDSGGASIRTFFNNLPAIRFDDDGGGGENNDNGSTAAVTPPHPAHGSPPPQLQQQGGAPSEQQRRQPKNRSATVKVDTRKLGSSLHWQQQPLLGMIGSALLCLVENEMLVVHAVLQPQSVGFFTYYVPVHFLPQDVTEE